VVEEFDGVRRSGSIILPEGRHSKGWALFGLVLRLVNEHFRAGVIDVALESEVQVVRGSRRSYTDVLVKTLTLLEESFGVYSGLIGKTPRWVRELSMGVSMDKSVQVPATFKWKLQAQEKNSLFSAKVGKALVKLTQPLVKTLASSCGPEGSVKQVAKGWEATDMHVRFGESLELTNLREMLLKLKEEVDVCLRRPDSTVEGLLGSGPKLKLLDTNQAQHLGTSPKQLLKVPLIFQPICGGMSTYKASVVQETSRPNGGFEPIYKASGFKPKYKAKNKASFFKEKTSTSSGAGQAGDPQKPDPKGKAAVSGVHSSSPSVMASTCLWVSLDAGQASDPVTKFAGGIFVVLQTSTSMGCCSRCVLVGLSICPLLISQSSGGSSDELTAVVIA
jgi:hypothetical protein